MPVRNAGTPVSAIEALRTSSILADATFLVIRKRAITGCKFSRASTTARIAPQAAKSKGDGVTGISTKSLTITAAEEIAEIAAGIELSVAKRCFVMAKKAGAVDTVTLTGGRAKNAGLKKAIEKVLKIKVIELPIDPQLIGALGAAEYARMKGSAKHD